MKSLELSVAGKTFIAGEYLALTGGPALVLATEPRFRLLVHPGTQVECPFHPESPAGKFWNQQKPFFQNYNLRFEDPYQVGGFGASSAQFALLHAFWQLREGAFEESQRFYDWHQMLADYRNLPAKGLPPSGADVIGAVSGGLTWFDRNNGKVQTFAWPFQEVQLFLAHTGQKLATHVHLEGLGDFETSAFEKAMQDIHSGLMQVNMERLLAGLLDYRSQLEKQGWVAAHTREKIQRLQEHSTVMFAKGCGAMGSDVILVLCRHEDSADVRQLLQSECLAVVADSSKVSSGLQILSQIPQAKELSP